MVYMITSTTAIRLIEHMIYCVIVKPRGVWQEVNKVAEILQISLAMVSPFPVSLWKSHGRYQSVQ